MKWGIRKDPRNPNYTDKQRQRDRQFYGKGGERRINRKLNEGQGILSARNYESDRLYRARNKAKSSGAIGAIAGGLAGSIVGYHSDKIIQKGLNFLANKQPKYMGLAINFSRTNPHLKSAINMGGSFIGACIGSSAGGSLGTKISMNARGYSAKKARVSNSLNFDKKRYPSFYSESNTLWDWSRGEL